MLYLDIETVPLESALTLPYPADDRPHPSNYKDPAKIAEWRVADEAKWRDGRTKECSLNPRLGRVLCIGMGWDDAEPSVVIARNESQERHALEVFWQEVTQEAGRVVTWNGVWDLRFLIVRSLSHGITPSVPTAVVRAWFRKYSTVPHFDCRAIVTNWADYSAGEGLDEWSRFFGLEGKEPGLSGADVYPMFLKGEFAAIEAYCAQDVATTKAVYAKLAPMFSEAA
jgi:hypothetical protein